jgi:hypothetical protein
MHLFLKARAHRASNLITQGASAVVNCADKYSLSLLYKNYTFDLEILCFVIFSCVSPMSFKSFESDKYNICFC